MISNTKSIHDGNDMYNEMKFGCFMNFMTYNVFSSRYGVLLDLYEGIFLCFHQYHPLKEEKHQKHNENILVLKY